MLTHAIVHKYGPPALHDQWEFNHQRNNFQLRNDNDMYIRVSRFYTFLAFSKGI
jgi:hypothetical protein